MASDGDDTIIDTEQKRTSNMINLFSGLLGMSVFKVREQNLYNKGRQMHWEDNWRLGENSRRPFFYPYKAVVRNAAIPAVMLAAAPLLMFQAYKFKKSYTPYCIEESEEAGVENNKYASKITKLGFGR